MKRLTREDVARDFAEGYGFTDDAVYELAKDWLALHDDWISAQKEIGRLRAIVAYQNGRTDAQIGKSIFKFPTDTESLERMEAGLAELEAKLKTRKKRPSLYAYPQTEDRKDESDDDS